MHPLSPTFWIAPVGAVAARGVANAGGAWDDAKNLIETGPSLKLMSMVAIVTCGLTAKYPPAVRLLPDLIRGFGL